MFDALPIAAAVLDERGVIESVNRHWVEAGGATDHGFVGIEPGRCVFDHLDSDRGMAALASGLRAFCAEGSADQSRDFAWPGGSVTASVFVGDDERRCVLLLITSSGSAPALRTSLQDEPSYRMVVEDQTEMICRFLPDTTLTFVNRAYCVYFERTAEALLHRPFLDLVPAEAHAPILAELGKLTPDRPTHTYEHQVLRSDGTVAWHSWTDRAFFDRSGHAIEFQSVGRDVTAHKKTEEALRESETRFQQLADHLREVFWIFDWSMRQMIYLSPAFEEVFDRPARDVLDDPRQWIESVHPDDRGRVNETFRRVDRQAFDEIYRILRPDGSQRWVRDRGFPVHHESGNVVRIVGVTEDITERVVAEDRQRLSEERYRAAAEGGLDAFFLLDAVRDDGGEIIDFVFVDLNQRGADMVSRSREQVIGQRLCEMLPVNRTDGFFERYKKVTETKEAIYDEFPIDAQDEGIVAAWMAHQVIPVADGVAISTRDISDRKRDEQEIMRQREENQTILDAIPAFVFYKDADNNILRVNRAVSEAMGLEVSQIEGRHSSEFYPEEAEAYHVDDLAVIRSRQPKLGYIEKLQTDGDTRYIRTDKVPLYGDDGEPKGVIAIASDVTELKQTTERLRKSEKRFRGLFDRVPVSVWEQDLSGLGEWFGELRRRGVTDLEAYLDASPGELQKARGLVKLKGVNQATHELVGTADLDELLGMLRNSKYGTPPEPWRLKLLTVWNGQRSAEMQTYLYDVAGKKIDVLFRLEIPESDGQPDLSRALIALTDITANRQRLFAQAQVDQAARERQILGNELHDTLGQQLTGINMLAESLRRRIAAKSEDDAERVAELARMVGEANREVRRLISGLTPEPINPDQLEDALESIAEATRLVHQLPVQFSCPRSPRELDVETTNHLVLIAQEAVHNVAKHARAKRVELTLADDESGLTLTVRDDGIGMPAAVQAGELQGPEAGRGLSIMRFRSEAIGATITFKSSSETGTTVCCYLPAAPAPRLRELSTDA
ncbi:MAG: PAS domain S-box protein [Planctomycetota bacterium]